MTDTDKPATIVSAPQDLKQKAAAHLKLDDSGLAAAEAAAAAFMESYSADRAGIAKAVRASFDALMKSGTDSAGAAERLITDFRRAREVGDSYGDDVMAAVGQSLLDFLEGQEISRKTMYVVNLHVDTLAQAIEEDWRRLDGEVAKAAIQEIDAAIAKSR